MKESIGSTFLYNIIFIFIIIVMGLLTATLNYYKGYKVNSRILDSVEKFSGYNTESINEINRIISGIGYTTEVVNCSDRKNAVLVSENQSYCLYYYSNDTRDNSLNSDNRAKYYSYGVTTFISVELPIVGKFRIPVFSKGERIYRFSGSCQRGADCN